VPISFTPVSARGGFDQTVLGYTREEAMAEADRCLDCHTICSLCVGVCPNLALLTYRLEPSRLVIPRLRLEGGAVVVDGEEVYRTEQALQVAVVTDFCNECGNCVTVCPTAGEPYRDKPRLYLDRAAFEAESANAFMLFDDGTVEARYGGMTHQLSLGDVIEYQAPGLRARLEMGTLALLGAEVSEAQAGVTSLRPAAEMYALARGLRDSMPQLPQVHRVGTQGTRVPHPAYAD
jgi:putative selenate reductase